jgi:beta-lactamase class A
MLSRRHLVAAAALLPFAGRALAGDNPEGLIAEIEKREGGRLGVSALDTHTGRRVAWRADERFPMCSTFKLLAVADLFRRVEAGQENLDRWMPYGEADLLSYAPVTRAHVAQGGMHLVDLAAAAISWSDNTAANLILSRLGGPAGVTEYVRSLGDRVTRLDRSEPDANTCIPGDPRDTTTPSAMLADLDALTLGHALPEEYRTRLISLMVDCQTGAPAAQAIPEGWHSANKTGSGANGTRNNIALLWPPGRRPILAAVYYTGSTLKEPATVLGDIIRILCGTLV